MLIPRGNQMRVLGLPMEGAFFVCGSAGSGKSIMALTRALNLAIVNPAEDVLLLVYVRSLSAFLNGMMQNALPHGMYKPRNLHILGFHQYVHSCYEAYTGTGYGEIGHSAEAWDQFTSETAALMPENICHHIVVDEGQDYTASMIQFVRKCYSKSLTVFLDSAQTIFEACGNLALYQQYILMSEDPVYFQHDYRNCAEITHFANAVRRCCYWQREVYEQELEEDHHVEGRKPCFYLFDQKDHEDDWLCRNEVIANRGFQSTAFLFATKREVNDFYQTLIRYGIPEMDLKIINNQIDSFDTNRGIFVSTYYNSKGLEFDNVFLPDVSFDAIYRGSQTKLRLFYVTITRAKRMLNLCCFSEPHLLSQLPRDTYDIIDYRNRQRFDFNEYFKDLSF